ncbi:uncharacterized protein CTHT_0037590 [Thermochaetoides thermophila DSM 1495]|uniref:Pyruvate decarboxylase n=1 Tax=Chaetomium thermophilum (strain DSM 1495 / CBS 144.50 / IMI 039719) TaxID=759272 RepID=G0S7Z9_CHATD|nr:hypothetical protein CTHT_0037590 [Thermochaetoides thermophila DSM 1495]EGS21886.1 hypothetical protein CTHT_0037590 [Thermochaetoides thermophila DSM 1495]
MSSALLIPAANNSSADLPLFGSDAIIDVLSELGVLYIAFVPGSCFRGLQDSIINYKYDRQPEVVVCLLEDHAIAIAHGFTKVLPTSPMAAAVRDGVGLMNAFVAIDNAHLDRVGFPILGGKEHLDSTRRNLQADGMQKTVDEAAPIKPLKFYDRPVSLQGALQSIITAFTTAVQVPRSPTYVCLGASLQEERIPVPLVHNLPKVSRYLDTVRNSPRPARVDVQRVQEALLASPPDGRLFLYGRVGRSLSSWSQRISLAAKYKAHVLTDLKLPSAFPTPHPLHPVTPSLLLDEDAIQIIRASEIIIAFNWVDLSGTLRTAFSETSGEPPQTVCVVSVTLEQPSPCNYWSKNAAQPPVDIAVHADVDKFIEELLVAPETVPIDATSQSTHQNHDHVASQHLIPETKPIKIKTGRNSTSNSSGMDASSSSSLWRRRASGSSQPSPLSPLTPMGIAFSTLNMRDTPQITLRDLAVAFYKVLTPASISFLRLPLNWPRNELIQMHPFAHLGHYGESRTGLGPGYAVGAALALKHLGRSPHNLIPIAVLDDGDFLAGCQALWTAANKKVPMLVVVMNSRVFGDDQRAKKAIANGRGRVTQNKSGNVLLAEEPLVDVMTIAEGFGCTRGSRFQVARRKELEGVLHASAELVRHGKVVVLDVLVKSGEEASD